MYKYMHKTTQEITHQLINSKRISEVHLVDTIIPTIVFGASLYYHKDSGVTRSCEKFNYGRIIVFFSAKWRAH